MGIDYSNNNAFDWATELSQSFYIVNIQDIKVGTQSMGLGNNQYNTGPGTLVDSGTTLIIFNTAVYNALGNLLQGMCTGTQLVGICNTQQGKSLLDGYCYNMNAQQRALFPDISFSLAGTTNYLTVSQTAYLIPQGSSYCLGIANSQNDMILGDVFMRSFHVVFERASTRVGFGPISTCPTPSVPPVTSNSVSIYISYTLYAIILYIAL